MKQLELKYGCNPNQKPASISVNDGRDLPIEVLNGKPGYINFMDALNSWQLVKELKEATGLPAAASFKHVSPAGAAVGLPLSQTDRAIYFVDPQAELTPMACAYIRARGADRLCSYGDWAALSDTCDAATAAYLKPEVSDGIIAPDYTPEALEILTRKKNIRLMKLDTTLSVNTSLKYTNVNDGLLVQEMDMHQIKEEDLRCVTNRKPTPEEIKQLLFGWKVVKHVKSNAIVLVKDDMTIGVGAGQMNRVGSAKIAIEEAGEKAKGSVMASDAFFPMPDTVEEAIKAGVTAIIQPGGSIRDQDSIDVCNEHGIAMVYTGIRHFKH